MSETATHIIRHLEQRQFGEPCGESSKARATAAQPQPRAPTPATFTAPRRRCRASSKPTWPHGGMAGATNFRNTGGTERKRSAALSDSAYCGHFAAGDRDWIGP